MRKRREIQYQLKFGLNNLLDPNVRRTRLIDALNRRINVFCLSTGRSGTETLQRIWATQDNVTALHEPRPFFHRVMRKAQSKPEWARDFMRWEKLPAMSRYDKPVYIETSHLFFKGFFEPAIDLGLKIACVSLTRNPRDVARSMLKLNTIPGRTEMGLRFYSAPFDPVFLQLEDWERFSDYQLCYWYTQETEQRRKNYLDTLRILDMRYHEIQTHELNELQPVMNMLEDLAGDQIRLDAESVKEILGRSYNRKSVIREYSDEIDFQKEEEEVEASFRPTTPPLTAPHSK